MKVKDLPAEGWEDKREVTLETASENDSCSVGPVDMAGHLSLMNLLRKQITHSVASSWVRGRERDSVPRHSHPPCLKRSGVIEEPPGKAESR